MEITDYCTIRSDGPNGEGLSKLVTDAIKEGWQPYQAPFLLKTGNVMQVLVKREKNIS